jgi:hypothetical protein
MDNTVSISKLKSGDILEKLRFSFIADRVSLIKAFKDVGILVKDENDLKILADLNKTGVDKKGLPNSDGKILKININQFVDTIHLRHDYLSKCSIKWID